MIAIKGLKGLKPVLLLQGADQTADASVQAQLQVHTRYYRKSCHVLHRMLKPLRLFCCAVRIQRYPEYDSV